MTTCNFGPKESVGPPTCQQIEPALTPAKMVPASQASRMASSTPCKVHKASKLATLPPPTHTRSARSMASATGRFGWVNSARWSTSHPESARAEYILARYSGLSPVAVSTRHTRGRSLPVRRSASSMIAPGRSTPPSPGVETKPPLLAKIRLVVIFV